MPVRSSDKSIKRDRGGVPLSQEAAALHALRTSFTGSGNCVLVTSYSAPHSEQVKVSRHSGMAEKRAPRRRSQYLFRTTAGTIGRTTPIPDFRAPDPS